MAQIYFVTFDSSKQAGLIPRIKNLSIMETLNSFRAYVLLMSDSSNAPEIKSINEIINDSQSLDYEYAHSLMEDLDALLDLKRDESMYFLYNRDNKQSKSVIKRIQ